MSETSSPPRRRWRFLYQFSLRTLLLATAAVAIFCNWYFQPQRVDEVLADGKLTLRSQVRPLRSDEPRPVVGRVVQGQIISEERTTTEHGTWQLFDDDGFKLAAGRKLDGQSTGWWSSWYPTGHKAAEGKMLRGVKVGLWRTWYEDGTLASEVHYGHTAVKQRKLVDYYSVFVGSTGVKDERITFQSSREGSSKAWYENGQLQYQGAFQANQQHGTWTYYDHQGRITATGPFRAGKRHGQWTVTRRVSEGSVGQASSLPAHSRSEWTTLTVEYIDGRTADELARLLTHLEAKLADPLRYHRQQALVDLAEIGQGALPLLQTRLTSGDKPEQAAILGVLPRMKGAAGPLLATVRGLAAGSDPIVAHHARLALFQLDPSARDKLFASLAEAIAAKASHQALAELVTLYQSDESQQSVIFGELMRLSQQRKDVTIDQVAAAVGKLDGDITPHVVAACQSPSEPVRLTATKILHAMVCAWPYSERAYVRMDEPTWSALVKRLKGDSSREIQALASEIEQGPRSPLGGGAGFF